MLLSSHLMGEIEQVSDRVGVIRAAGSSPRGPSRTCAGGRGCAFAPSRSRMPRASWGGSRRSRRSTAHLELAVDTGRAAEVNKALVDAGIAVSELAPQRASLEEVFLELTGGESR